MYIDNLLLHPHVLQILPSCTISEDENFTFTQTGFVKCMVLRCVTRTVTSHCVPVQQMHSEWNTKWKQRLWLYHTWQNEYIKRNYYKTKNYSYTNFLRLLLFPTMSLSTPYLSHFTTPYINSRTLHMHAPHTHTTKKEEPKLTQTLHPWIHRQKS